MPRGRKRKLPRNFQPAPWVTSSEDDQEVDNQEQVRRHVVQPGHVHRPEDPRGEGQGQRQGEVEPQGVEVDHEPPIIVNVENVGDHEPNDNVPGPDFAEDPPVRRAHDPDEISIADSDDNFLGEEADLPDQEEGNIAFAFFASHYFTFTFEIFEIPY